MPVAAPPRPVRRAQRGALWRLNGGRLPCVDRPPLDQPPEPEPESLAQCLIELQRAIARAERWYAARERGLAEFDRRAAAWRTRGQ